MDWEALLERWSSGRPISWGDRALRHEEFDSDGWLDQRSNCDGCHRIVQALGEQGGEHAVAAFHRAGSGFFLDPSCGPLHRDLPPTRADAKTTRSFKIAMNPTTVNERAIAWRQVPLDKLGAAPDDVLKILSAYGRLLEAASRSKRAILTEIY